MVCYFWRQSCSNQKQWKQLPTKISSAKYTSMLFGLQHIARHIRVLHLSSSPLDPHLSKSWKHGFGNRRFCSICMAIVCTALSASSIHEWRCSRSSSATAAATVALVARRPNIFLLASSEPSRGSRNASSSGSVSVGAFSKFLWVKTAEGDQRKESGLREKQTFLDLFSMAATKR